MGSSAVRSANNCSSFIMWYWTASKTYHVKLSNIYFKRYLNKTACFSFMNQWLAKIDISWVWERILIPDLSKISKIKWNWG